MTKLQERLRENCVGRPATIEWPHRILHEAANALDAAELIHKSDVTMIEQITLQRDGWKERHSAAEAEIARLLKLLDPPVCRLQLPDGTVPANAAEAAIGWKREYDRLSKDHDAYRAAQPPAVGEERAKDVIEDWLKQSRFADVDFPGIGARLIAEKLDSANLLRTKDAG